MNYKKIYFTFVFILGMAVSCGFAYAQDTPSSLRKLFIFYSPGCNKCVEAKSDLVPKINQEFGGLIQIEYRDITNMDNYKFLLSLRAEYKEAAEIDLPVFFFEGKFLSNKKEIVSTLKSLISRGPLVNAVKEEALPVVDLTARFRSFALITVIGAGLIDGINPCAFTVIVFFISFLALQGYRKKELIVIGLSFVSAVFLTYLLVGLGIFNFIYQLKGFWVLTKVLNISIGLFSIVLAILAAHDFLKFRKDKDTQGMLLQLPESIKNRIHYVIGMHYRKTKPSKAEGQSLPKHVFRLGITALFTGFLVSILEAICTGQTYLPTISFILKTTELKLQALAYLLLYNLMFITPLLVIFLFALLGVTSGQFSAFLKKHLLTIKILMAVLFFGLGVFLIWKA
ncbi:MAG: hypothetical protein WC723_01210 [Candidatus Omnitrophota bacterium]